MAFRQDKAIAPSAPPEGGHAGSAHKPPRILIVEDDADQRQLIHESLCLHYHDPAGSSIVAVGSACEAMAQDLGKFDVVLLDYNLPDMDGLALVEAIRAKADVPVVLVTSENVSDTAGEAIRRGAQDYVVKLGDYLFAIPCVVDKNIRQHRMRKENERLRRRLEAVLLKLRRKNVELRDSNRQLETLAATDHLTKLANRRRFAEIIERCFSEAVRYGFDLACCMCDLDHYKQLNDALGHQVGDEALVAAAEVIRSSLRSTDVAARYGGDEFVLLFPHASLEDALVVSERIRSEVAMRTRRCTGSQRRVSMSMGLASLEAHRPSSADELISIADRALYAAKAQGRDRIVVSQCAESPAARR